MSLRVLELFGGIGACSKALERLGIDYEIADYVEIDKYAVKSFNAMHGTNFEPQDIRDWDKNMPVDFIMHGSPCQDFSVAGKNAGGDEGSGTRSSLMYETLRIVDQLRPKYVLWENVKNLLSTKHKPNWDKYCHRMAEMGYVNTAKVLNAKDYGIPQNRERVYTLSIRKDVAPVWKYEFPEPMPLEKRLKDVLESNVDEKYYLSDKMVAGLIAGNDVQKAKGNGFRFEPRNVEDTAVTISTKAGTRRTDNYISEPTLKEKLCDELVEKGVVKGGEIINHSYTTSEQRKTLDKYIESDNGIMPTMTTRPDILGYVEKENHLRIKNTTAKGYLDGYPGDGVYTNIGNKRGTVQPQTAQTLATNNDKGVIMPDLRIRKLTPKECWRLMGFDDSDFEKAAKVNSNAQLYKQAGNSIVVDVLVAILRELLCK